MNRINRAVLFFVFFLILAFSVFLYSGRFLPFNGDNNNTENPGKLYAKEKDKSVSRQQIINYGNIDESGVSIDADFPAMATGNAFADGENYQVPIFPGAALTSDPGLPSLPNYARFVAVPKNAEIKVEILGSKYTTLSNYNILPAQEPETDSAGSGKPDFIKEKSFYKEFDGFYPENPVKIEDIKVLRGVPVTTVRVFPVQYNPAKKELRVYTTLKARLSFQGGEGFKVDPRLRSEISEELEKAFIVNHQMLPKAVKRTFSGGKSANGCEYLIITHPDFLTAANTLRDWKIKKGVDTRVVTTNDTGATANAIRAYIQQAYDTWTPAPDFILFIGDSEFVPTNYIRNHPSHNIMIGSDLYYACVDPAFPIRTVTDSYTYSGAAYSWVDATDGTNTGIGGSTYTVPVNIGFNFNFYGTTYTSVNVCKYGYVSFGNGNVSSSNDAIPDFNNPNNIAAVFWDYITFSANSKVYYKLTGVAPNRELVIEWNDVGCWGNGSGTFQMILYETTNKIKFQYKDVVFDNTSYDNGQSATAGLERPDGLFGTQYVCCQPSINNETAVEWTYNAGSGPSPAAVTMDNFPDLSTGRLPVDTLAQAEKCVNAIITYEKTPPSDAAFYKVTAAAYFQDDNNDGYADRRFTCTSEDIRNFLLGEGYEVDRVYWTYSTVTPTNYNNSGYSYYWPPKGSSTNGDPLPAELLRANGFAWDGDAADISDAINAGRFLLTHRDHGATTFWDHPRYYGSDAGALTNQSRLPVVWSLNCQTGWFDDETDNYGSSWTCFCESWMRNSNGGAVGIIGATRNSYSGYNDRLAWGLVDAIWPDFEDGYSGQAPFNNPQYRMGQVLNYGKLYMHQWFSDDGYMKTAFGEFHWFGDPEMKIATLQPQTMAVTNSYIYTGATSMTVSGAPDGAIAALTRNNEIIGRGTVSGGSATLNFPALEAGDHYLTVTAHNNNAFEKTINVGTATDQLQYQLKQGWNKVTFPFESVVDMGDTTHIGNVLFHYNTGTGGYDFAFANNPSAIKPAYGYWIQADQDVTITVTGTFVSGATQSYHIQTGWNQFGNAYADNPIWGNVSVNETLSLQKGQRLPVTNVGEAIDEGWFNSILFTYNTNTGSYDFVFRTSPLEPKRGYWLKATHDCYVIFSKP